jgi:hypothetical protein
VSCSGKAHRQVPLYINYSAMQTAKILLAASFDDVLLLSFGLKGIVQLKLR